MNRAAAAFWFVVLCGCGSLTEYASQMDPAPSSSMGGAAASRFDRASAVARRRLLQTGLRELSRGEVGTLLRSNLAWVEQHDHSVRDRPELRELVLQTRRAIEQESRFGDEATNLWRRAMVKRAGRRDTCSSRRPEVMAVYTALRHLEPRHEVRVYGVPSCTLVTFFGAISVASASLPERGVVRHEVVSRWHESEPSDPDDYYFWYIGGIFVR